MEDPTLQKCSSLAVDPPPEKDSAVSTEDNEEKDDQEIESSSPPEHPDLTLPQLSDEIDRFLRDLSAMGDESAAVEVPCSVETFCGMVESLIAKYESGEVRFGQAPEHDSSLDEALGRVRRTTEAIRELSPASGSQTAASLNRTGCVLHRWMLVLEEEFRVLLEDSFDGKENPKGSKTAKQSSFGKDSGEASETTTPTAGEENFPAYSPEAVSSMRRIARAMTSAGYDRECCEVFAAARRHAFDEALRRLGLEPVTIEDVQRMQWEALNGVIAAWIKIVKHCATVLFPGESRLCRSVFPSDDPDAPSSASYSLFPAVAAQLLNFAEAVAMTKRSAEKLFKVLDLYESLQALIPAVEDSHSDDPPPELRSEAAVAMEHLGAAAVGNFCDLENSIKSNTGKTPVPGGALHPITRYTMNYLTYACEYKETLEQVFLLNHRRVEGTDQDSGGPEAAGGRSGTDSKPSPFASQLGRVMGLLDLNLEANSKLYKDPSLRNIFLMNNGRYILQKIKGSAEISQVMGDTWCRKRSSELRQYHKNYQRDSWLRVLGCLRDEGVSVSGKVSKPMLKERFKNFNTLFEEIHRTQSTWIVSDEQLQSELRVSISSLVIPAYRSFLGRFQQYLDAGRQTEKYIKLQPEDIETAIDELFEGNPASMARRRA